jgi:hypothetical protein
MPSPILTDGATFTCPHGGTGTVQQGISISALAQHVTIGGHKPILSGASITGFTVSLGCSFMLGTTPAPCVGFSLPPPSGNAFADGGQAVYTAADAATIALAPSTGNSIPGLTISEPQSLMLA